MLVTEPVYRPRYVHKRLALKFQKEDNAGGEEIGEVVANVETHFRAEELHPDAFEDMVNRQEDNQVDDQDRLRTRWQTGSIGGLRHHDRGFPETSSGGSAGNSE